MHGRLSLGLAVATLAWSAAPATAHEMTWDFATLAAHDYWQARGVTAPCDPQPVLLSEADEAELAESASYLPYMLADETTCGVWITPLAEWHRQRSAYSWEYCTGIVHELGHLAGLGHDYGGVMDHTSGETPFACSHPRQWAVKQGWRKAPRWVRNSPPRVERLWRKGSVWRAKVARARWLER